MNKEVWNILVKVFKILLIVLVIALLFLPMGMQSTVKPVIYLYPEQTMDVDVQILYRGDLTVLYPAGDLRKDVACADGERDVVSWQVTARTDGTVIDHANGREYSYLFWEGDPDEVEFDFSKGFCVAGEDTAEFLQEILPQIGLTPREYNEFIVYWLPLMQDNPYNIISFQTEVYEDLAQLKVEPQPDNVLRVFMAVKPSNQYVEMDPQSFEPFVRDGFTVVEWGGTSVR